MSISMFLKSQTAFLLALGNVKDVLARIQEIVFSIIFSFLDGDQLRQSAMVLQELLSHTAC